MINTPKHLAYVLGVKIHELEEIIFNIDNYYSEWSEIKTDKNGNPRINKSGLPKTRIFNPSKRRLKIIQTRILRNILSQLEMPDYTFGAMRGKDNVGNAKRHQGKKFIFTTDLKDFFPSINHTRVFEMFRDFKFSPSVSKILTQLVTYKGRLPQGAPTSPTIANLTFVKLGKNLELFAKENKITFTSFIDDLTFSSPIDFKDKVPMILKAITDDGFKISHNKTNYKTKDPKVTGVPVKNNWLAVPKSIKNRIQNCEDKTPEQKKGLQQYADKIIKANQ